MDRSVTARQWQMYTERSEGFADHERDALGGEGAGRVERHRPHDGKAVDDTMHLAGAPVALAHDAHEVDAAEPQLPRPAVEPGGGGAAMRMTSHGI